jgi:hypothetical protein
VAICTIIVPLLELIGTYTKTSITMLLGAPTEGEASPYFIRACILLLSVWPQNLITVNLVCISVKRVAIHRRIGCSQILMGSTPFCECLPSSWGKQVFFLLRYKHRGKTNRSLKCRKRHLPPTRNPSQTTSVRNLKVVRLWSLLLHMQKRMVLIQFVSK